MSAVDEALPVACGDRGPHTFSEGTEAGEQHALRSGLVANELCPEVGLHALQRIAYCSELRC